MLHHRTSGESRNESPFWPITSLARHQSRLGLQPHVNRFFTPVSNYPVVAEVRTSADQSAVIGGTWHTDHSYDQAPAMCSVLSARQLPPYGGDTHFASMAAAYRAMLTGLQKMLSAVAWHSDASFLDSNVGL